MNYNNVSSFSKIYITFTASGITSKNCCLKNIVSSLSKIYITFTASAITSKKTVVSSVSKIIQIIITFTASAFTSRSLRFFDFSRSKSQIIITFTAGVLPWPRTKVDV